MSNPAQEFILVAEDSAPNRNILCHLIKKLGFQVIEATNAKEAWEKIEKLDSSQRLLAIFSDVMMPDMDGIQLLEKVRSSANFANIPFTLVTAVSEKEYVLKAKELKVNGYILKPVSHDKVLKKLTEFFPNRKFPKLVA
jgi:two-component system chemotaxis response regulator CheY